VHLLCYHSYTDTKVRLQFSVISSSAVRIGSFYIMNL